MSKVASLILIILLFIIFSSLIFIYIQSPQNTFLMSFGKNVLTNSENSQYSLKVLDKKFLIEHLEKSNTIIEINLVNTPQDGYKIMENGGLYASTKTEKEGQKLKIYIHLTDKAFNDPQVNKLLTYLTLSSLYSANSTLRDRDTDQLEMEIGESIVTYEKDHKGKWPITLLKND